jgi:hypothetical protein
MYTMKGVRNTKRKRCENFLGLALTLKYLLLVSGLNLKMVELEQGDTGVYCVPTKLATSYNTYI